MRTLSNAITRNRVHHAYLFVGSRGTGKTSMAKILAASLNCEQGPTLEPCGVCESCTSIAAATSIDVVEMDAASNNSVDDIRELRGTVSLAPLSGRRKLYVLDEAHMLSTAAWNAFLKTLEEPPPMTVFVLATTEADKVPATVVDRCHRFDFHRPTVDQIAEVVTRAAVSEGIEIPPRAVAALSRQAAGSFRDALGLLEQIVTYSGSPVTLEDVLAVVGAADVGLLAAVVDAVAAGDGATALRLLDRSCGEGREPALLARELEVRARELMVVQTLGEVPAELRMTPEDDAALAAQAERVPAAVVIRLLELLADALEAVRAGADGRTRLELALVKAARPDVDGSLRALLSRIERLEGAPGAQRPAAPVDGDSTEAEEDAGEPPLPDESSATTAEPSPAATEPPPDAADDPSAFWAAVVELVRGENAMLGALVAEATPSYGGEGALTLTFARSSAFKRKKAEEKTSREVIAGAVRAVAGAPVTLTFALGDVEEQPVAPVDEGEIVARMIEEFDAEEIPGEWDEKAAHAERGG